MATTTSPPPISDATAYAVARLLGLAEKGRRTIEHVHDVPTAELRIFWLLSDGRSRTLKEISDELGLEQSTVNRQVAAARSRGHLVRHREPDSTSQLIELAPDGRAAFDRAAALHYGVIAAGIHAVGADRDTFIELLTRFVDAFVESADALES